MVRSKEKPRDPGYVQEASGRVLRSSSMAAVSSNKLKLVIARHESCPDNEPATDEELRQLAHVLMDTYPCPEDVYEEDDETDQDDNNEGPTFPKVASAQLELEAELEEDDTKEEMVWEHLHEKLATVEFRQLLSNMEIDNLSDFYYAHYDTENPVKSAQWKWLDALNTLYSNKSLCKWYKPLHQS